MRCTYTPSAAALIVFASLLVSAQALAETTANDFRADATIPDVRRVFDQPQLLKDERKFELCKDDREHMKAVAGEAANIAEPDWRSLAAAAGRFGILEAFLDTQRVFEMNRAYLGRKDAFAVAIYSKTNRGKRKIYLFDLTTGKVLPVAIQHGKGEFGNAGHYHSSVGCFLAGMNAQNFAFSLHGLEGGLNNLACERRLQVHISHSAAHPPSYGCLTIDRRDWDSYEAIANAIAGGGLLCAFDEGRLPDRHSKAILSVVRKPQ